MTLERGTLLHKRYRIVEILGQGGMGSVYRAVDENLGVEVAVKENLFTTDEYARQFRLEAVILANLRHPNLPRVTDHFVIGEQGQYLVMDYIEGEDLRQRMERLGMLPEEEVILIGAAMADALAYLHSRKPPILHRDVKPGNVKITPEGTIFLVDFGLAKVLHGSQATTTGARAMTPGYSPPEQYGTARTDPRTDIYSLGATLYAALTGVIPEDGLARAMDNAVLTPVRKRNPKVSRRLAAAIEKAMAVRPDERFQSGDEFKRALLAASSRTQRSEGDFSVPPAPEMGETPAQAENHSRSRPAADASPFSPLFETADDASKTIPPVSPGRKPGGCWWGAGILTLLLLAGSLSIVMNPGLRVSFVEMLISPTPITSPTASPLLSTNTPAITATLALTLTNTPNPTSTVTPTPTATPPGGGVGQIAFVSDRTGSAQIYVSNIDGTELRPVTNLPEGACQPSWSPDGKRLVFVSPCAWQSDLYSTVYYKNATLFIINVDGSGLRQLIDEPGGDFEPAWSPDGKRVAFTSLRDKFHEIYLVDVNTRVVTRLTHLSPEAEGRTASWSPLGNQLVLSVKRFGAYQIFAISDTGQGLEQIVRSGTTIWDMYPVWAADGQSIYFSQRHSSGPSAPWLMSIRYEDRVEGDAQRVRAGSPPNMDVSLSPDGLWLIYEGLETISNPDLYIFDLSTGEVIHFTTDPAHDFDPAWRP